MTMSQTKRSDYGETGKYVTFTDTSGEKAAIKINQDAIHKDLKFAGYNRHFLICYLTVLLERIFQFIVMENKYSTTEVFSFIRKFRAIKSESKYINTTTYTDFIDELSRKCNLPLTHYFLTETQIKSIFNYKL